MKYKEKRDRAQISFLPACVEDYIDAENPVRVIDAFVDSLDMEALGFRKAKPAQTGRPAYDPRDLLKLYLYGYLTCSFETKKMFIAQIIKSVRVSRDYNIEIEFNVSFDEFRNLKASGEMSA